MASDFFSLYNINHLILENHRKKVTCKALIYFSILFSFSEKTRNLFQFLGDTHQKILSLLERGKGKGNLKTDFWVNGRGVSGQLGKEVSTGVSLTPFCNIFVSFSLSWFCPRACFPYICAKRRQNRRESSPLHTRFTTGESSKLFSYSTNYLSWSSAQSDLVSTAVGDENTIKAC